MSFVEFRRWTWPRDAAQLLRVSILDIQAFKDEMVADNAAPKTMNRRISSLSSFYKFLGGAAAEPAAPHYGSEFPPMRSSSRVRPPMR